MSDNKQKIYAKGSAKEVGQYGTIAISLNLEQLKAYANDEGYVKIFIQKKREKDSYGNTHFMIVEKQENKSNW